MSGVRKPNRKSFPPNLYQDTNGYFSYRNPQSGKRKGVGKDKAVAFREARAANAVLANLESFTLASWISGVEVLSLAQWVPQYFDKWKTKTSPSLNTERAAVLYLKRVAEADFAWMPLKDIAVSHIAKLVSETEAKSGASTAILLRGRMSDMFRMAETLGMIEPGKNPVTPTYTPSREVVRERLSLEQFLQIREHAPVYLRNAMNLALLTGQRREDICAAKFSDYRDGYLYVIQGKSQGKIRLQQDTSIRLDAVGMSIEDVIRQCRDDVVSPFLIHHTTNRSNAKRGDPVALNGISNKFQAARMKVGIEVEEGRTPSSFHEIRSLSERLYRAQYGADFAQAILGHKHAKMTATYDDLRGSGWQIVSVK